MSNESVKRYGIKEQLIATDELDVNLQELDLRGYTVIDGGFSKAALLDLRESLEHFLSEQADRYGGREFLAQIGEENTLRAPLLWNDAFLDVALQPKVLELCKRLLGDYFILNQQNGIRNPPAGGDHQQAKYHRDLPYQHFVSSRPLALNALLCLDPFTAENGSTRVIPGSHKIEYFPDDRVVRALEVAVSVPEGAYLVLNSMVFHCAGSNTTNKSRCAVNTVFSLPIIRQQIALPPSLGKQYQNDEAVCRLLGVDVDAPRNLDEWFDSRKHRE